MGGQAFLPWEHQIGRQQQHAVGAPGLGRLGHGDGGGRPVASAGNDRRPASGFSDGSLDDGFNLIRLQREKLARAACSEQTGEVILKHPVAVLTVGGFDELTLCVEMGHREGEQAAADRGGHLRRSHSGHGIPCLLADERPQRRSAFRV
ncbi:hypothetical protein D3C87_1420580 [compost metagenome]